MDSKAWISLAVMGHLALASAALETFAAGSPVRWWMLAIVGAYFVGLVAAWRLLPDLYKRTTVGGLATFGGGLFLALLALTAWLPGGTQDGIRLFTQSTPVLLASVTALAVAVAGVSLARLRILPAWARYTVAAIAAYGMLSFVLGIKDATPYGALFQGGAFWTHLPRSLQGAFVGALVIVPLAVLSLLVDLIGRLRRHESTGTLVYKATALAMVPVMGIAAIRMPAVVPVRDAVVASAAWSGLTESVIPPWHEPPEHPDEMFRAVEAAEKAIPEDTFAPRAVVSRVGKDPVALFEWVRDNTYWVPYRGALRGPVGVLMDRLGNSLDRSLLLAEVLTLAGHKVQLAHAALEDQPATDLLGQVRPVPRTQLPPSQPTAADQDKADLERYARDFHFDAQLIRSNLEETARQSQLMLGELDRRVATQARFLADAVGKPATETSLASRSLAAVRDHWWVQLQQESQWVDLDPLLPTALPAAIHVQPDHTYPFDRPSGEIPVPSEFAQEITVRVIVEQWKSGRLTENTALTHTFRPAEVFGRSIAIQNVPLAWPKDSRFLTVKDRFAALSATALRQKEWLPILTIADQSVHQSSFTETGELNDKPEQAHSQDIGAPKGPLTEGFDALGGESAPETPRGDASLTAEWIEYETRVPGEQPRSVRRDIFDLVDQRPRSGESVADPSPDGPKRLRRALSLLTPLQILPLVCRLSPEYVMKQTLSELDANREALSGVLSKRAADDVQGASDLSQSVKPTTARLLTLGLTRFAWHPGNDIYLDRPNIVSYRTLLTQNPDGVPMLQQGFDIVTNPVAIQGTSGVSPFQARLSQGIADTNVESLLLGNASAPNAGSMLDTNESAAKNWLMIRRVGDLAQSGTSWPRDVRNRMEEALRSGYLVLAPRLPDKSGGSAQWAWWRIDPATGETLGMGQLGWGQGLTEYILIPAAVGLVASVVGYQVCTAAAPANASPKKVDTDCTCEAIAWGLVMVGLTAALMAAIASTPAVAAAGVAPTAQATAAAAAKAYTAKVAVAWVGVGFGAVEGTRRLICAGVKTGS